MGQDAHRHLRELEVRLSSIVTAPPADVGSRLPTIRANGRESPALAGDDAAVDRTSPFGWYLLLGLVLLLCVHGAFVHYRLFRAEQAAARAETRLGEVTASVAHLRQAGDAATAAAVRRTIDTERMITILAAPDARRLPLRDTTPTAGVAGQVIWSRTCGLLITAVQVPPAAAGEVYQVWGQTRTGSVNLGSASVDGHGRLTLLSDPAAVLADDPIGFYVTREPRPGSSDPRGAKILTT